MHGIIRHKNDQLIKVLVQLEEDAKTLKLPCDHIAEIIQQKNKLKELYSIYQDSLQRISSLIKQYEQEQKSTRFIIVCQKRYLKRIGKKEVIKLKALCIR